MAESTVLLILLSALLVGLVASRLFKKKERSFSSSSGTFTIPEDCTHIEVQMVGAGGGGSGAVATVATPEDRAMLGLSQQIEQDMYSKDSEEESSAHDDSCPYCPQDGEDDDRPVVDVPRKAKPRKKKASKKKAPKKNSRKKPAKRKK